LGYFRKKGFEVKFSYLLSPDQDKIYYSAGKWPQKASIVLAAAARRLKESQQTASDIVYVQREGFMLGTSWFEKQMARRSALVFDFDDAIWLADVSSQNRGFGWLKSGKKTSRIIKASHAVIAGNDYLADYARQFNTQVTVIPTTIDTEYHKPLLKKREDDAVCIGWTGSLTTVQYFEKFTPVLERLKKTFGKRIKFKLIGEAGYRSPALGLQGDPWRLETEIEDLNAIDVGIMPLPDDQWTRGKCGFKGLQYMGCGIPAVMSPVGVNTEIIQDGINGFLANTPEDWYEKLSELIESEELRNRLGNAGRKTVIERYSVLSQRDRYLQVLRDALSNSNPS
jgi:glycosyltransferase involved in cell wall biosynthesis